MNSGNSASIQRIPLQGDVDGSRGPTLSADRSPAKSLLRFLQNVPGRGSNECVIVFADAITHAIERISNLVRSVSCDVFTQSIAENLTSRLPRTTSEPFNLVEHFIGDGYGGFHTRRITGSVHGVGGGGVDAQIILKNSSGVTRMSSRILRRSPGAMSRPL